jgi:hypothetical protein
MPAVAFSRRYPRKVFATPYLRVRFWASLPIPT